MVIIRVSNGTRIIEVRFVNGGVGKLSTRDSHQLGCHSEINP